MADEETGTRPSFDTEKSMALEARDDPFAAREGKTLTWRNVDMTLVRSRKTCPRHIFAYAP
jgi:hypothetical protein